MISTMRWPKAHREFLAEDLLGRECPECGSTMHYSEAKPPWFNPVTSRAYAPAVIFGRHWCVNVSGCELAPG